jgi:UDP-glucose 4-epimerase
MHFARWLALPIRSATRSATYRNNVLGTLGDARGDGGGGCQRFVFSSTCAVYGEPVETPLSETHPTSPINAYGQTKLAIEHALPHFERALRHPLDPAALFQRRRRRSGRRARRGSTVPRFTSSRALRGGVGGEPLQLFGDDYPTPDGTCLRDYIHVVDLADAHVRALARLEAAARPRPTTSARSSPRPCAM